MIIMPQVASRIIDQEGGEEEQEEAEGVVLIVTAKITEGQVDQEGTEKIEAGLGEEWEAEVAVLMMGLIERAVEEDAVQGVSGDLTEEEEEEETAMAIVMVKTQTLLISETVEELSKDKRECNKLIYFLFQYSSGCSAFYNIHKF